MNAVLLVLAFMVWSFFCGCGWRRGGRCVENAPKPTNPQGLFSATVNPKPASLCACRERLANKLDFPVRYSARVAPRRAILASPQSEKKNTSPGNFQCWCLLRPAPEKVRSGLMHCSTHGGCVWRHGGAGRSPCQATNRPPRTRKPRRAPHTKQAGSSGAGLIVAQAGNWRPGLRAARSCCWSFHGGESVAVLAAGQRLRPTVRHGGRESERQPHERSGGGDDQKQQR